MSHCWYKEQMLANKLKVRLLLVITSLSIVEFDCFVRKFSDRGTISGSEFLGICGLQKIVLILVVVCV